MDWLPTSQPIPWALGLVTVGLWFVREKDFPYARVVFWIAFLVLAFWTGSLFNRADAIPALLIISLGIEAFSLYSLLRLVDGRAARQAHADASVNSLTTLHFEGGALFELGKPSPAFGNKEYADWHILVEDWTKRTVEFLREQSHEADALAFDDLSQRKWVHETSDMKHNLDFIDLRERLRTLRKILDDAKARQ